MQGGSQPPPLGAQGCSTSFLTGEGRGAWLTRDRGGLCSQCRFRGCSGAHWGCNQ